MLRIPRIELDAAINAVHQAAAKATTVNGGSIVWHPDRKTIEAAVLGALSIIAPHGGPCTAADVHFVEGFGASGFRSFPTDPRAVRENDQGRA